MINKVDNTHSTKTIRELEDKINELEHEKEKLTNEKTNLLNEKKKLLIEKEKLELLVRLLQEQMALTKSQQYAASSEKHKYVEGEQLGLFDEAENTANLNPEQKETEEELEEITYKRKKHKKHESVRSDDFSGLPVEEIHYELNEDEQICECCGGLLHEISVDTRIELEIIPAIVRLKKHIKHNYGCRCCEKADDAENTVVTADSPDPIIRGSFASPSAIAYIIVQKYLNAVPLYRQELNFKNDGINLSRQTMANWIVCSALNLLIVVCDRFYELLIGEKYAHADETRLQVLHEVGRKATQESFMWLYQTGRGANYKIALYEYQATRSSSHPKRFLKDFSGYLHTDGYSGYHNLPEGIIVVGCWAHARRKFTDALKALPEIDRDNSEARQGLKFIDRLFKLEAEWRELSAEERLESRIKHSKPIAEALLEWAKGVNALPKSLLGKAIYYLFSQWKYLSNVFLDGNLELSNNRAERAIKPFVIGRKNWLFSNTVKGAEASSIIYSIIETCKLNNVKPFEYLEFLLENIGNCKKSQIDELLPWSASLPEKCRVQNPK